MRYFDLFEHNNLKELTSRKMEALFKTEARDDTSEFLQLRTNRNIDQSTNICYSWATAPRYGSPSRGSFIGAQT